MYEIFYISVYYIMYQVPLGGIGFTSNAVSLGTNINASNASINNLSVTSATIGQLKTSI